MPFIHFPKNNYFDFLAHCAKFFEEDPVINDRTVGPSRAGFRSHLSKMGGAGLDEEKEARWLKMVPPRMM
jgi:hypothetical protein